jgi:type I restriction enzyme, S subunit
MKIKRNVLMSIKPKYVKEIINGNKLYEFRKTVFHHENIDRVIIYASSPIKMIVAEFNVANIISGSPKKIWEECKENAGMDEESFMKYFNNKEKAFSISIDNLMVYDKPINPYDRLDGFRPPQSYMFVNARLDDMLNEGISA